AEFGKGKRAGKAKRDRHGGVGGKMAGETTILARWPASLRLALRGRPAGNRAQWQTMTVRRAAGLQSPAEAARAGAEGPPLSPLFSAFYPCRSAPHVCFFATLRTLFLVDCRWHRAFDGSGGRRRLAGLGPALRAARSTSGG